MAFIPDFKESDRDTDDRVRASGFFNEAKISKATSPIRPTTFRSDGSSVRLQMGGVDREEAIVRDTSGDQAGSIKRGFRGSDLSPGIVRNTPFSKSGTPLRGGFADFDTPSKAQRSATRTPSRVRRPNAPPPGQNKFRTESGTNSGRPPGDSSGQFEDGDFNAQNDLFKGGIQFVTDPITGFTVPNLADDFTNEAFNRFFDADRQLEFTGPQQDAIDRDPTRAAFQNRFFK